MKITELIVRIVPEPTCPDSRRIIISVVADGKQINGASQAVPDDDFVSYFDSIMLEAKQHLIRALKAEQGK